MSVHAPIRMTWFTAAELADLALPGLSKAKRKINETASVQGWAFKLSRDGSALARPRLGRGGGLEYHVSLLPPAALNELIRRGFMEPLSAGEDGPTKPTDQLWAWFDRQPDRAKAEAHRRLQAIEALERLERGGLTRTAAISTVSAAQDVSCATIWNWMGFVAGVAAHERLPHLAPRRQGGGAEAQIDDDAWRVFKSDYLRPEKPSLSSCYERLKAYAGARGIAVPHLKTLQRKLEREVDGRVIIAKRQGLDALRLTVPAQQRTIADLTAMELVNIDGHRWDVFVRWPDGHIARPMMVAIQDVYSRKFLAWRVAETESAVTTRLAFADLFTRWGIPVGCLLDNGRAFASKWITGGAKTRFRFKVRPEDPLGLLTQMGVQNHWATPYRGQSKPIERAFKDLCDHGAKHPAFAGAYTGNNPMAKPENYGSKAIDLDVFLHVANRVMQAHNARQGRRTEAARGASYDDAFSASYERHPVRKATPEQLRLALLAAEHVTADRRSGAINFHGNRYWIDALSDHAGQRVVIRFDPQNLASEVHVYAQGGQFLVTAPVIEATGFLDVASAKVRAKQEADLRRKTREMAELEQLLSPDQLADLLPDDEEPDETPAPKIVRPVRLAGGVGQAAAARRAPLIDRLDFEDFAPAREARAPLRLVE